MKDYRIEWTIDLCAENEEDAARQALEIQRNPNSIATVFIVTGPDLVQYKRIDLTEIDEEKAATN